MPARTGGGCCCRCMWLDQDWPDLPTPHVDSLNVASSTQSVTLVTDDGSPIGCRKGPSVFDFKQLDKQTPSIEMAIDISFDVSPLPPVSYSSEYFIGQSFSAFELLPDGKSHTFAATIDRSFRYEEVRLHGGTLWLPIIDATIPTSPLKVPGNPPQLYAEQDGHHYSLPFAGATNFTFPGAVTGDWGRWTTSTAAAEFKPLADPFWVEWGPRVTVSGRQHMFTGGSPDFSDGAPPIYFGWCFYLQVEQQYLPASPGGMPIDGRFYTWNQTIRLDRFCMTIT